MASFESRIKIDRPIEDVFAFVADQGKLSQWQTGLVESGLTSEGPTDVGSTYRYVFELFGRRLEATGVITEFEPNHMYAFKALSGSFPVAGSFTFVETWGGTRVVFAGELPQRGVSRMAGRMMGPMLESQLDASFERLKEILEAEAKDGD
ncbi:SRPBCC family protein [Chloroflexota bacterium]